MTWGARAARGGPSPGSDRPFVACAGIPADTDDADLDELVEEASGALTESTKMGDVGWEETSKTTDQKTLLHHVTNVNGKAAAVSLSASFAALAGEPATPAAVGACAGSFLEIVISKRQSGSRDWTAIEIRKLAAAAQVEDGLILSCRAEHVSHPCDIHHFGDSDDDLLIEMIAIDGYGKNGEKTSTVRYPEITPDACL